MRPDFVDNRNENTLGSAVSGYLQSELETRKDAPTAWIASSYFKPEGFPLVADVLEQAREVRLLLGAEPEGKTPRPRKLGEAWDQYQARLVNEALQALHKGLADDRNLLGFMPEVDRMLERLIAFLHQDNVEVRLYRHKFLHGKAFVFPDAEGVLVGSSNFTAGGLRDNLELNLGRYDPEPVRKVTDWFQDLWADADPYDLAAVYEARFQEWDPYLIYLRVLWELYGEEEKEDAEGALKLTDFQKDGLVRARRIIRDFNGVLVADDVGLGKTFIGGELIRDAIYNRRQRALLIAPAALRDGTWATFFAKYSIHCESLSYEQLSAESTLGGNGPSYLRFHPSEYSLIVIDESQAFRNPNSRRAEALRRLLGGTPPKDVVLLSATPVNNSLWDLYYLLGYFIQHDAVFSKRGIPSLQKRFREATAVDPFELRPEMLFDVLDSICVRRTRHFVKKWYPNAHFYNARGEMVPVRFPKPQAPRVDYHFGEVLPGFFDELEEALMPENGHPKLSMARYAPSRYQTREEILCAADPEELAEPFERQLVGLLRTALLKRFESSVHSFAKTAQRMVDAHDRFLRALGRGYVCRAETLAEIEDVDTDEALDDLLADNHEEKADQYDIVTLTRDIQADRQLLAHFAEVGRSVQPEADPKLKALKEELVNIVKKSLKDGYDEDDQRDKRKVLIFSYYSDTVEWIEEHLNSTVCDDETLSVYEGRIASVTSDDSRGGVSRKSAIYGFAPVSTDAPPANQENRFDILICTDVLAEGMNLQQCRHVINYDLPWNPMRLVQRNGRIDRIGSPYDKVFAHCFFPDKHLDDLLSLEERIRNKLAQAAASVGVGNAPIPDAPTGQQCFSETREELARLVREDPTLLENAGEPDSAYSGEEYRQELSRGLERQRQAITNLPWAAGSGHVAQGKRRGWAFCARVGDRVYLRFVSADITEVEKDTLTCLKQFTCEEMTERRMPQDLQEGVYEAWSIARRSIFEEWTWATDPANLELQVPKLFRQMADHVRRHPPAGITVEEMDDVLDRLEAPWPRKTGNAFRDVFSPDADADDPADVSRAIVGKVKELGLQPFLRPEPLPPIDEGQIALVCWMAVTPAREG